MGTKPDETTAPASSLRVNQEKWGKDLMDAGYTVVPNIIIEKQHALGLQPVDFAIVMVLSMFWWRKDSPARPGKKRIATALHVDPRTVQRRLAKLEKLGLIRRQTRRNKTGDNDPNEYLFTGLLKRATDFAKEKLALDQKQKAEQAARIRRAKPSLSIVE